MDTTKETIRTVFAMLDKQLTAAEFDAQVEQNRFLAEVKSKKFGRLRSLGMIGLAPRDPDSSKRYTVEERREVAEKGHKIVLETDAFPAEVAVQLGLARDTFRLYCREFGLELPSNLSIRRRRDMKTIKKALQLINRQGHTLKTAANELGMCDTGLSKMFRRNSYAYSRSARSVTSVKK